MSQQPNILTRSLAGDDIGWYNISHYNRGRWATRRRTSIALPGRGGVHRLLRGAELHRGPFGVHHRAESRCAPGLTKVGMPGADVGLDPGPDASPSSSSRLATPPGSSARTTSVTRTKSLPSNHGFDEFFGNLYHLNAEDEPEHLDYPKDPVFREKFGPRGVIHSYADGRIEDTGTLTKKRMETIDDEVTDRAVEFIRECHAAGKPFFVWWNATRMHVWTRLKEESVGLSGQGEYNDAMVEHDGHVGRMLDVLDELGIMDNTIVMYSTDNGPHYNCWPDGAIGPWRSEKNSNWEGAYRVHVSSAGSARSRPARPEGGRRRSGGGLR